MTPAATLAPNLTVPSAFERTPTTQIGTPPKKTEPTPAATATVTRIAREQHNGHPPSEILAALAPDIVERTTPTDTLAKETLSSTTGAIESPDVAVAATATDHLSGETTTRTNETTPAAPLPIENPAQTEQINHLLRDAVNHLVGRHDERFVLMASAMAASPQTPLGSELRRNALITLRNLEPRTGIMGLIDKTSQKLTESTKDIVAPTEHHSTAALAAFLDREREALSPDLRDELFPTQLLTKIRTGEIGLTEAIQRFSGDRRTLLKATADHLHHEATGKPDGRMPTLYDPREMLKAASVDNLWNRLQIKQMIHPEQFNAKEYLTRYGPIGFILFMSVLQLFPQDQKQQSMGH